MDSTSTGSVGGDADVFDQFQAGFSGQRQIGDHNVRVFARDESHRFGGGFRHAADHHVAFKFDSGRQPLANDRVIIDQENAKLRLGRRRRPAPPEFLWGLVGLDSLFSTG